MKGVFCLEATFIGGAHAVRRRLTNTVASPGFRNGPSEFPRSLPPLCDHSSDVGKRLLVSCAFGGAATE